MSDEQPLESDARFLSRQYADSSAYLVRVETHRKYSNRNTDTFGSWLLEQVGAAPGELLADIGCGPGLYHPALARAGVKIVAFDTSPGMVGEAKAQALQGGFGIDGIVASAEQIPLADDTFDRVMANHMLYHVPDQRQALREMRRIAKPGARVVLSTNAPDNIRRLYDVHVTVARRLGYTPTPLTPQRFDLNDLPLVRDTFPDAEVRVRENALVFPDPEGPTRYYGSYFVNSIDDRPADNSHRQPLLKAFHDEMESIITRDGPFHVPSDAGCFVATA